MKRSIGLESTNPSNHRIGLDSIRLACRTGYDVDAGARPFTTPDLAWLDNLELDAPAYGPRENAADAWDAKLNTAGVPDDRAGVLILNERRIRSLREARIENRPWRCETHHELSNACTSHNCNTVQRENYDDDGGVVSCAAMRSVAMARVHNPTREAARNAAICAGVASVLGLVIAIAHALL